MRALIRIAIRSGILKGTLTHPVQILDQGLMRKCVCVSSAQTANYEVKGSFELGRFLPIEFLRLKNGAQQSRNVTVCFRKDLSHSGHQRLRRLFTDETTDQLCGNVHGS